MVCNFRRAVQRYIRHLKRTLVIVVTVDTTGTNMPVFSGPGSVPCQPFVSFEDWTRQEIFFFDTQFQLS